MNLELKQQFFTNLFLCKFILLIAFKIKFAIDNFRVKINDDSWGGRGAKHQLSYQNFVVMLVLHDRGMLGPQSQVACAIEG